MKEKTRDFLRDFGSGAAIGAASMIPGGSGGTLATMFGVYDRHLGEMNDLRKHFWHNLKCLLPIILGFLVGIIPCVWLSLKATEIFFFGFTCLSCGTILGGFPLLTENMKGTKPKKLYIWVLIGCALFAAAIGIVSGILAQLKIGSLNELIYKAMNIDSTTKEWIPGGHIEWWFYLTLLPVGVIVAIAIVLPGISGSMLLLIFGYYDTILSTINVWIDILKGNGSWDMAIYTGLVYVFIGIGLIVGFFTVVKLFKYCLEKARVLTYYGIVGFVGGSIISLFYNAKIVDYFTNWQTRNDLLMPWVWELISGLIILFVVAGLVFYLSIRSIKKSNNLSE
ncbi:MAG: DUF368 domain-containing protein [Erysipelotrichaceae bacterium]|jgi:putative membrane protein|nr:DUF368 domain-containing protein [Erysipelotrichaceae bacterium]